MACVLIADDDGHIREVLRFALERDGHEVLEAEDGARALTLFETHGPDLVVLDILMPEMDGMSVCRKIRETAQTPVLFLSSRDEEVDRVVGLDLGADDFIGKPFSPRELTARVRAVLRRGPAQSDTVDLLRVGALTLDPSRHACVWQGTELNLTVTEFSLLRAMMGAPGRVYSRAELVDKIYHHGHFITDRTIDSHVRRLRKKFRDVSHDPVETVFGVGYRLNLDAG